MATPATKLDADPAEVLADLSKHVEAGERVVLTRKGAPVAAVVSIDELHRLEAIEAEEDRLDAEVARARQGESAAPWDEVRARLGL